MTTTQTTNERETGASGGYRLLPAVLVLGLALLGGSASQGRPVAAESCPTDRQAPTPLQPLIDSALSGSVLRLPPGRYAGPVTLSKPLTLDGGGLVTIDAGGQGTVISLETNGTTLRDLHITGSGVSHDSEDACLRVRGHGNILENLVIDDCLFGIDLKQADDNIVRGNRIRSKSLDLGMRGDGIRLWYARRNLIEGNEVVDSRDVVAWYSHDNIFRNNIGRRSRYSIHFMFANDNLVEGNRFEDNAVGIYFMYTEGGIARHNIISRATGAAGMAIGFMEASGTLIEDNRIIYCAVGIGSDLSPSEPEQTITIRRNHIAYNGIGVRIDSEVGGNNMLDNNFEGNIMHVAHGGRRTGVSHSRWSGNYWDNYQGFDRNADDIGDVSHHELVHADRLWMQSSAARFFKAAPAFELLDFLERLAPFSPPETLLRDDAPSFSRVAPA